MGVGGLADMEFGTEEDVSHLSFQFYHLANGVGGGWGGG